MDYIFQILLYFSMVFFPWLLIQLILSTKRYVVKEKDILKMEDEYEKLRNARKEYIYQYYWSKHNKELDNLNFLKKQIISTTKELEILIRKFDEEHMKLKKNKLN